MFFLQFLHHFLLFQYPCLNSFQLCVIFSVLYLYLNPILNLPSFSNHLFYLIFTSFSDWQNDSPGTPIIPELLRDIMNLEPLLSDDDIPADFNMDGPFVEQALYTYMMQLAELRLYKLVRWARNLPQFGAISVSWYTYPVPIPGWFNRSRRSGGGHNE